MATSTANLPRGYIGEVAAKGKGHLWAGPDFNRRGLPPAGRLAAAATASREDRLIAARLAARLQLRDADQDRLVETV